MQSFPVTAQGAEENFDSSLSTHNAGVKISYILDVMEETSYFGTNPFTFKYIVLAMNSCLITCTNTQSFAEGENFAYAILVAHLGILFHIFGSFFTLFCSKLEF